MARRAEIAEALAPLALMASDKALRLDWRVATTVPDALAGNAAMAGKIDLKTSPCTTSA